MSKKNQKSVAGVSVLCVLLTMLLTACLLLSVEIRMHAVRNDFPKATSVLQLDRVNISGRSLARVITEDYIQDSSIGEEQMKNVLREGTFRHLFGNKVYEYNEWLLSGGEGAFPQVTVDDCILAIKNNYGLLYRETGFQMTSETEMRGLLEAPVTDLNDRLSRTYEKGLLAFFLKASVAGWFWIVPSVLLLAVLIWLTVPYVRSGRGFRRALMVWGMAAFVPSLVLLGIGFLGRRVLENTAIPDTYVQLEYVLGSVGSFATLACLFLISLSTFRRKGDKKEMASLPVAAPEESGQQETVAPEEHAQSGEAAPEEDEKVIRHYCRFCGELLVNNDAKFCYKCGKPQEKPNSDAR